MSIRVVVVDDHEIVRVGIVRTLSDVLGIEIVGEACSGEEALAMAKKLQPDVMLMDIKMPGIGGLEATRKLMHQTPHTKVVAVTALEENPFPSKLLQAGAMGYISKGADVGEMVTAIKHAMLGKRYISPVIAQQMALGSLEPDAASPFQQLSERELQICLMITNCEKVQDISDKLCLSPKTVNTYRYRVFDKLGVNGDVELTRLAIRHGLLDDQDI
jgi:DNA-binding NarL/FixJ family response regulator